MNPKFEKLGFYPADVLLPKKGTDMTRWAVVACDQFTSQPEYWQAVENLVGDAPSSLRLILPEAGLNAPDVEERIAAVNAAMGKYLAEGLFETLEDSLLYIERVQSDGKVRHGLIGMVDLEQYDFTPGSGALIRATEGTVLERIPPRVRVRKDAPIELPHVMLLIDDPNKTVIEPLTRASGEMERLYAVDLQQGGGSITGWKLTAAQMDETADALAALSGNVSANLLGLGNAATPLGIQAARRMAAGCGGRASDELCTLVVLNTASIQLLPTTVAGVRAALGAESAFDILPAVWLASALSVAAGLLAAKALGRVWRG